MSRKKQPPTSNRKGLHALTDISAAPESKRSKTCPHCGNNLSVYAVKCHFCHANLE